MAGLVGAAALLGLGVASAAPDVSHAQYRVRSQTVLVLDRWRGTRVVTVERTDIRQRLQLDGWRLGAGPAGDDPPGGLRLDARVDLEIGSDVGPPVALIDEIPDTRRTALDLYAAEIRLRDAWSVLDAALGRQVMLDALGLTVVDGASVELRAVPYAELSAYAGLAARRGWSGFGPDLYGQADTALPEARGYVVGAGARTRELDRVSADLSWRRRFDTYTVRDEVGAAAHARPIDAAELSGVVVGDLAVSRLTEARLGGAWRPTASTRVGAEWSRVHPAFSLDTIWNAFITEPSQGLRLDGLLERGPWRYLLDAEVRLFDAGPADAAEPRGPDQALIAGARIDRAVDFGGLSSRLGVEGRIGTGYGGARHHLDAFGRFPIRLLAPRPPVWLRVRLGGAYVDVPARNAFDGFAGWAVLAAEWQAAPGVRIDGAFEAHSHAADPFRMQAMTRLTLEELW